MVLSLMPFARGLMDAWVKRVAQVVFEKAAIVFGLVVVFGIIAAQPPSLLSIAMLIVSPGCGAAVSHAGSWPVWRNCRPSLRSPCGAAGSTTTRPCATWSATRELSVESARRH